jgi:hypothetical protein
MQEASQGDTIITSLCLPANTYCGSLDEGGGYPLREEPWGFLESRVLLYNLLQLPEDMLIKEQVLHIIEDDLKSLDQTDSSLTLVH